jgi:hypothetical protein
MRKLVTRCTNDAAKPRIDVNHRIPVSVKANKTDQRKVGYNSVFRINIPFATLSKPLPALSGTIQSVLVVQPIDHSCQLTALPSSQSEFGYGAHRLTSAPIPTEKS